MRILHIWNTAGVGSIIAKYMDKEYGTQSWVVMRKSFDKFGFTTYGQCWDSGAKVFTLRSLWEARKCQLFHVHGFDKIMPFLRKIYGRPVVLHYHGTDIRKRWVRRKKYWAKANAILYCTRELVDEGMPDYAIYLPNPIDRALLSESQSQTWNGFFVLIHG